ncbi:histidine phosphatase family protein [Candidatus Methylospira mobilis]|uniref:Histidine phosphatase family protein n=1 Tax=Candidatus Methylospira mobilis TaxID=1808979 RepID=A0A5Q0BGI2_9GAMM|nr:histidine phosphatase family protein [Candidatus Methylospira mobilis]QFY41297.1 histidine phosphatase family protein [Candidatus Methylospira mobilis]WNV05481.1 histidine phosphatase family protein [Candidatus Methylospira mobilis]
MSLNLYLLRHGETEASLSGGYCGRLDPDLTEAGHEMAHDFAEAYQEHSWSAVYVSPLLRTRSTAAPICRLTGLDMRLRDGLRELDYGCWEGKSPAEVEREYHDDYLHWLADPGWNAPTAGERGIDVAQRALGVLAEIQAEHASGNVLVISHKATLRLLLCSLMGIDVGSYRDRVNVLVASVAVVEFGTHGPLLVRLGDRSHLRSVLRERPGT